MVEKEQFLIDINKEKLAENVTILLNHLGWKIYPDIELDFVEILKTFNFLGNFATRVKLLRMLKWFSKALIAFTIGSLYSFLISQRLILKPSTLSK